MKTFKDLKEGIVRGDKQTVHVIHGTAQTYDPKKESWAVDTATYKIKGSVFTKTALKHGLKKLKDQFPHHKEHEVTLKEEWRPAQGHKYHSKTNDELRALETVNRKGQEAASKDNAHQAHVCGVQADIARAILNHRETSRERHLKESAWDTYRRQALTEASLNVKTLSAEEIAQKHGVSLDTIKDQIAKGIKVEHEHATSDQTAEEIARDHLGERPDYYEKLDKANLEEADLKAQWNDDYRKDAYARAKNIQRTIKQQLNPKTPGLGNKAWKRADKEERENRKSTVSASLHEESDHLAQFSHHWAQFKLHDNLAHPRPGTIVYEHLPKRNQHEKEMNKHYKNLTTQQKNALRLHEETEREAASHKDRMQIVKESYQVGDHVVPKIGPHAGQVHRVIHVHPTGHVNITPAKPGKNRYHLGAAKADPKDLEDAPGHGSKKLEEAWKDNSLARSIVNRKSIQEVFQAAKDKKNPKDAKVKPGDFDKDKDLKTPGGDKDPEQAEVQAKPPQFGSKDQENPQDAPEAKPKSNVPKPERQGNKIIVKGPGPEDKFQSAPIVTAVSSMTNTGGQGVK